MVRKYNFVNKTRKVSRRQEKLERKNTQCCFLFRLSADFVNPNPFMPPIFGHQNVGLISQTQGKRNNNFNNWTRMKKKCDCR